MHKLEEILHAEEAARHAVAAASERAEATLRDALARTRSVMNEAHGQSLLESERLREERLEAARAEAAGLNAEAAEKREAIVASARERLDASVTAVVRELVG